MKTNSLLLLAILLPSPAVLAEEIFPTPYLETDELEDAERFIDSAGNLSWKPKVSEKKQESTKDNKRVFISKKAEKLIAPMSCKYLPIKAGKLSGKKFYVETNHYTEIEKKLLEQTCKKGARAEKIVSNLQTVSGYSTSKLITLWTKSYNGENKHYVKDSGWIALANFDNTINVQRSIRLFSEDPDFTTQKSNDIFLDLYKKDTESDNLIGNIVFEWNITEEGIVSAISDYAKKITPDLEKISHGKL